MNCSLFRGLSEKEQKEIISDSYTNIRTFSQGTHIFEEGDSPESLYMLLSGHVAVCKLTIMGRRLVIADIETEGDLFGEVYLFIGKDAYDMGAEAVEESKVMIIGKKIFNDSKYSAIINRNLMTVFANKAYMLSSKVRMLGCSSIREKIVHYILARQDENGKVMNQTSREVMADYLNVTRPSLSRELGKMCDEGIIAIKERKIIVTDQKRLEEYI